MPRWIVIGLLIRLVLMPLHHPWDLQTWYNMFVDLAHNHSPYATFHELTASYRADQGLLEMHETPSAAAQETFYAYYAYPPLLMILYYPLAKLAQLFVPLYYQFTMHGPAAQVIVPPLFHVFFKPPLFLAEVGIALLLWRMAGERAARLFFLNPLVIIVSATWTVEALMAFPAILSMYLLRKERYAASAIALAAGALIKFLPAVLLPAALLYLWHRGVSRRTIAVYAITFLAVCAAVVAPFWAGFREVLLFQTVRTGANMSLHLLLYPLNQFTRLDMRLLSYVVSPLVGLITQTAALALVYAYLARRRRTLSQAFVITLVAYFLGSKVVNEPYPYLFVPLLALEIGEHPSEAKEIVLKLLYALPLAFAFVNVPIVYIAAPLYRYFWRGSYPVSFEWARAFPLTEHSILLVILALAFIAASIYTVRVMMREETHDPVPAAAH
ncbi:MAG: hypothetical protein ACRDGM_12045 [bacterium]